MSDKVVGLTKLGKNVCCLTSGELEFVNNFAFIKSSYYVLWTHYIFCQTGKAIPLQAWTGPEGSGSLRLPDFKTIDT